MPGEVSEWFKEHAWKACRWPTLPRGFESRSLRHINLRNPVVDVIFRLYLGIYPTIISHMK